MDTLPHLHPANHSDDDEAVSSRFPRRLVLTAISLTRLVVMGDVDATFHVLLDLFQRERRVLAQHIERIVPADVKNLLVVQVRRLVVEVPVAMAVQVESAFMAAIPFHDGVMIEHQYKTIDLDFEPVIVHCLEQAAPLVEVHQLVVVVAADEDSVLALQLIDPMRCEPLIPEEQVPDDVQMVRGSNRGIDATENPVVVNRHAAVHFRLFDFFFLALLRTADHDRAANGVLQD
jgi:hypothetical protein